MVDVFSGQGLDLTWRFFLSFLDLQEITTKSIPRKVHYENRKLLAKPQN
jgi:hypothetical protein